MCLFPKIEVLKKNEKEFIFQSEIGASEEISGLNPSAIILKIYTA